MASVLLAVILGASVSAFMSLRKTQGQAVTQATMKMESQRTLQRLYTEFGQLKRIIASTDNAPSSEDIGMAYYKQLEMPAGMPYMRLANPSMRFPRVSRGGVFSNVGPDPGQMNPTWFGNALIFVIRDRLISLATPNVTLKLGGGGATRLLSPTQPYRLASYKFVCYFMDEHPFKAGEQPIISDRPTTYGLVRWESKPLIEKSELNGLYGLIPASADRGAVWTDLKNNYGITRTWDINQPDPTQCLFDVDASGDFVSMPNEPIACKNIRPAIDLGALEPYARGMLSYNTLGGFALQDLNDKAGLDVPRFGEEQTIIPYGFEVGVCGPNAGRAVLVRLALAARLSQGKHIYGQSQQTIIQTVDN